MTRKDKLEVGEIVREFHARFGRWKNERALVFGESIKIPYATDQFSLAEMDDDNIVRLHAMLADGIYALAIAGMDDNGIQIFQDMGDKGARFEIASFSWRETPIYLHLEDKKLILEITHDSRIEVDKQNKAYSGSHQKSTGQVVKPDKIYIIPLRRE